MQKSHRKGLGKAHVSCEIKSKLLVPPLTRIVVPYITPFKEFRLQLMFLHPKGRIPSLHPPWQAQNGCGCGSEKATQKILSKNVAIPMEGLNLAADPKP